MHSPSGLVTLAEIFAARAVIAPQLRRTPVSSNRALGDRTNARASLKLELFQKTGSFKARGVLNALTALSATERAQGVISISAGNHAQALAWGASLMGIRATVVMPANAVQSKLDATRGYGGEVIQTAEDLLATCLQLQQDRRLVLVHPFDDRRIIAGAATVGVEIVEDVPDVDVVIVGCGGGGLLSGVAAAVKQLKPSVRVIGVEPRGANAMIQSLARGEVVRLPSVSTIADGLAAPFAGVLNLAHVQAFVDDMAEVDDSEIVDALRFLMTRAKVVAEPAAAAAAAALLSGRVTVPDGARIVVIVSGGNVDLERLKTLL